MDEQPENAPLAMDINSESAVKVIPVMFEQFSNALYSISLRLSGNVILLAIAVAVYSRYQDKEIVAFIDDWNAKQKAGKMDK